MDRRSTNTQRHIQGAALTSFITLVSLCRYSDDLIGGVIKRNLMGFPSPVEGTGSLASAPSQTAVAWPCSAQSPGRQVDLLLCVTDRLENR